jgi:hypothetical protein
MSDDLNRRISSLQRAVIEADLQRAATTPEARLAEAVARGAGPVIRIFVQREIASAFNSAAREAAKALSVITRELA